MANPPGAEPFPGLPGAQPFGPQPPEAQRVVLEDKKPRDDKLSPDVIAMQKQINETENRNKRLEKELAELKAAQSAPKKDTASRDDKLSLPNPDSAFDTESRTPLARMMKTVLGKTMTKFLRQRVEPGPHTALGMSAEIRKPNWFKRMFLKLPFIGLLAPAGMASFPGGVDAFYKGLKTVGDVAGAGKDIALASVNPALGVGLLGGLARGAVDGIRWAVMKEKTMSLFARELVNRKTDQDKTWDESAVWNTVMGDRADIAQLVDLSNELRSGATADSLMLDKTTMKMLIERGFRGKLEKLTLERIVSREALDKLTPAERLHLQDVDLAYEVAEKLFDQGFSPAEKAEFLQDRLPRYLETKEVTNHLKAMTKRGLIAGVKTSLVGMAASLFGTLSKTSLFADWRGKIGNIVTEGVGNIKDYVANWYSGATAKGGALEWFKNIPLQPDPSAVTPTPLNTGLVVPNLPNAPYGAEPIESLLPNTSTPQNPVPGGFSPDKIPYGAEPLDAENLIPATPGGSSNPVINNKQ